MKLEQLCNNDGETVATETAETTATAVAQDLCRGGGGDATKVERKQYGSRSDGTGGGEYLFLIFTKY